MGPDPVALMSGVACTIDCAVDIKQCGVGLCSARKLACLYFPKRMSSLKQSLYQLRLLLYIICLHSAPGCCTAWCL